MSAAAIVGILVALIVVGVAVWYVAVQRHGTCVTITWSKRSND